jgi:hypothetical protein
MHGLRQRSAGHSNADMLHALDGNTRSFTCLADYGLQIFTATVFTHARQFATGPGRLAQQLRAVAYSAVCLGAARIDSQVQWHDWTLFQLPATFIFAFNRFSRIMAWQTKLLHATANCRPGHYRCISD